MNATIAEFILQQTSDAAELAQRARVLAALTQLPPQRRNELAEAVNMVCRTIAAQGGRGKVRFSLVQRGGHRLLEVSVCDPQSGAGHPDSPSNAPCETGSADDLEAAVIQRVGELVDHFESSGWPIGGAVIRMAQTLSPAFSLPTDEEAADWAKMLHAKSALDALSFALRRARTLEEALGHARCERDIRSSLGRGTSEAENLTMLSLVISKTKNAISIMDPHGSIIAVNDAFVRLTGYSPAEAVSRRQNDLLFGPATEPAAVFDYQRAIEESRELTQDILQYRKDGNTFWVENDLIPVLNGMGALTRWIAISTDITRRRQTEEALREAKEIAETNSRLKSEFLANLSHEIRTPMNAIIGMTELTLDTDLTQQQRAQLETVRNSSEALLGLLNDILDLSKIEAGKMEMEEISFSLADVVHETVRALEVAANEKGLQVSSQLASDLPVLVRGDPMKLRQILFNLVGNAIKFTEHGEVRIVVEQQWSNEHELAVHFQVHDSGMGIPADKLDHIFQAFSQGDASTTREFGGTGLGLTISSELIRLMHGQIWVESKVGEGSTFHFTVQLKHADTIGDSGRQDATRSNQTAGSISPQSTTTQPATPQPSVPRNLPVRSLHVLIADDHTANRHLVATVLGNRGHNCTEAATGRQAVEVLREQAMDVVLMDVQMPVMDGFQATAEIRKAEQGTSGHLPIIALTAHAMTGDRERCLAAGMDAYLPKPLRPKDLITLVESVADLQPGKGQTGVVGNDTVDAATQHEFSAALESLDNDVDLLISQMEFFLNDGPALVGQIVSAIDQNEPRQLQLAAHRLKGMLARYGSRDAEAIALELEQKGEAGDLGGARPLLEQLVPLVDHLTAAIHEFIQQQGRE